MLSFGVSAAGVNVNLDGEVLLFDQYPVIIGGRTLVPMRKIFEKLGADVSWNDTAKTAESKKDGTTVKIQIDNDEMLINGKAKKLDVSAQLINGRTLVPARAVAEAFGCDVSWDEKTQVVSIETADYKAKKASHARYISPKSYSIAYITGETYILETGETKVKNIDYLLYDKLSASSVNVASIPNTGIPERADSADLKETLEKSLGVTFTSYEVTNYNYMPAVRCTYELDGADYTQIVYFTNSYVYTVTMGLFPHVSNEVKAEFEYIITSLSV